MENKFLGKWKLLSEKSEYSKGTPPKSATYEFKLAENKSLDVFIQWIDSEGKEFEIEYNTIPDGKRKTYENPQVADEVMSEFETDNVLNSYTYKGGETIAFASRIIGNDGILKVIQRFYAPDGKYLDNIQYYKKGL